MAKYCNSMMEINMEKLVINQFSETTNPPKTELCHAKTNLGILSAASQKYMRKIH